MSTSFRQILRRTAASLDLWLLLVPIVPALYVWLASMGLLPILREIAMLFCFAFFFGFSFTKMRGISAGNSEYAARSDYNTGIGVGFRFLLILALPIGLFFWADLHPYSAENWLLYPLFLFWLPASAMVMGLTQRLFAAINPADIARVIGSMGMNYWLCLATMNLIIFTAFNLAHHVLGADVLFSLPVTTYALMLGVALALTLLGAAAYSHHEELGLMVAYAPDLEDVGTPGRKAVKENEFVRVAKMLERDEGVEAAAGYLSDELKNLHAPLETHQFLLDLELRSGRINEMKAQGQRVIKLCLDQKKPEAALSAARKCLEADSGFCMGELELDDQLIQTALNRGQFQMVVSLCENFVNSFPRYRRSVDMSVIAADLLIERYGEKSRARDLLVDAISRGAAGEQLDQIREVMKKFAADE